MDNAQAVENAQATDIERQPERPQARLRSMRIRRRDVEDPVERAKTQLQQAEAEVRRQERRERRRFTAAARQNRRRWLISGLVVLALAAFVTIGAYSPLMAVSSIQIVGAKTVNQDDLRDALNRFDGVPLALVTESGVHTALEPFPAIQRYAIELLPPHTLRVTIEERRPVLVIKRGDNYETVDPAGVLLQSSDAPSESLPLAEGGVTTIDSDAFRAAAGVLRDLPEDLRAEVATVAASSGQDVSFTLRNGIEVIWGEYQETSKKTAVLTSMLTALADRNVSVIDVSSSSAPVFR